MTRYGTLIAWAKQLGRNDVVTLLNQTLDEESDRQEADLDGREPGQPQGGLTRPGRHDSSAALDPRRCCSFYATLLSLGPFPVLLRPSIT